LGKAHPLPQLSVDGSTSKDYLRIQKLNLEGRVDSYIYIVYNEDQSGRIV